MLKQIANFYKDKTMENSTKLKELNTNQIIIFGVLSAFFNPHEIKAALESNGYNTADFQPLQDKIKEFETNKNKPNKEQSWEEILKEAEDELLWN